MANVSFTVALEVIRAKRLRQNEKDEYYRVYMDKLQGIAGNISVNITYTLWKLTYYTDVLIITLTKSKPIYSDLLQSLSDCLTKMTLMQIETKTSTIEVITALFQNDSSRSRFLTDKFYRPVEHGRGNVPLEMLYRFGEITKEMAQIIVDKTHLSYQVKLESSDVYRDKYGTLLLINNTDRALTFVNTKEHEDKSFTACLDEVNDNIKENYMFGGYSSDVKNKIIAFKNAASKELIPTKNMKRNENSGMEFSKGLVLLIVFVGVVSFLCLSMFISSRRRIDNREI